MLDQLKPKINQVTTVAVFLNYTSSRVHLRLLKYL